METSYRCPRSVIPAGGHDGSVVRQSCQSGIGPVADCWDLTVTEPRLRRLLFEWARRSVQVRLLSSAGGYEWSPAALPGIHLLPFASIEPVVSWRRFPGDFRFFLP